jgi:copper chaperone CopZ
MTRHLLALLSLLVLQTACDKHDGQATQSAPATAAKSVEATAPTAAAAATPTATTEAAMAEHEGSCGNAEMEDGQCGGGCNQWDEAAAEVAKRPAPDQAEWTTIPVEGMHCGGCERRIIANLGEVDGVLAVEADAELGQVRVAYAPGKKAIRDSAVARIKALGYEPK